MVNDGQAGVLLERDGRLAYVTLNRPERLNAFSPSQWNLLEEALAQANADPEVRREHLMAESTSEVLPSGQEAGRDDRNRAPALGQLDAGPAPRVVLHVEGDVARPGEGRACVAWTPTNHRIPLAARLDHHVGLAAAGADAPFTGRDRSFQGDALIGRERQKGVLRGRLRGVDRAEVDVEIAHDTRVGREEHLDVFTQVGLRRDPARRTLGVVGEVGQHAPAGHLAVAADTTDGPEKLGRADVDARQEGFQQGLAGHSPAIREHEGPHPRQIAMTATAVVALQPRDQRAVGPIAPSAYGGLRFVAKNPRGGTFLVGNVVAQPLQDGLPAAMHRAQGQTPPHNRRPTRTGERQVHHRSHPPGHGHELRPIVAARDKR